MSDLDEVEGRSVDECCAPERKTFHDRLVQRRDRLARQLGEVSNLLAYVEAHPELEQMFEAASNF